MKILMALALGRDVGDPFIFINDGVLKGRGASQGQGLYCLVAAELGMKPRPSVGCRIKIEC